MSIIKIENLTFAYPGSPDNVFENLNLQLDSDWKLGFTGRNGRGKTTLLSLLMGEGEYDEDDAFEALFAEMTDGLEDDGEIGRIAQMLDAYMEARQDFMEENGLADD